MRPKLKRLTSKERTVTRAPALKNSPNASSCLNCHRAINEKRDTSIKCTACKKWMHLRCSALTSADFSNREKLSSVKCTGCTYADGYASEDDVMESGETGSDQTILQQILHNTKELRKSVSALQHENMDLKARLVAMEETNEQLILQLAALQRRTNCCTGRERDRSESRVRLPLTNQNTRANNCSRRSAVPTQSTSERTVPAAKTSSTKSKSLLIKCVKTDDNKPSNEKVSVSQPPKLPSVKARINTRRLHISKICSSVSAQNLYDHLKDHGKVHPITVKRLRSHNEGRRFYVEVLDVDYENAISDILWEEGTEISFYRGALRDNLVEERFPDP